MNLTLGVIVSRLLMLFICTVVLVGDLFAAGKQLKSAKWKVRFTNTFGTTDEEYKNSYLLPEAREKDLQSVLWGAAKNFTDHSDRLAYISDECSRLNLSEHDIITMGRYLSDKMGDIYDYTRKDGANQTAVVSPADQWNAWRNRLTGANGPTEAGACRDMTVTVAEFLIACGIRPEQIKLLSYRTLEGGHQVVQVNGEDGKTSTINWSELYQAENDQFNLALNPNIPNTGIMVTEFDPVTRKVIDEKYTELGHILASVTGGRVRDENYMPELLQLEANYSVLGIGAYLARTARGDLLKGVKLAYQQKPTKWLHLGAGVTYALNKLDYQTATELTSSIVQDIAFVQVYGSFDFPELELLKFADSKFYWQNNVELSVSSAAIWTSVDDADRSFNYDYMNTVKLETGVLFKKKKFQAEVKVGASGSISERTYNSQMPDVGRGSVYPYAQSKYVRGRVTLTKGNLYYSALGKVEQFQDASNKHLNIVVGSLENGSMLGIGYSSNEFNQTALQEYLTVRAEKVLKAGNGILGIGAQVQVPLRRERGVRKQDVRATLTLTYTN